MACGLPVVGVNQMGVRDLIKDGYNGYLAKPMNTKDFAAKLEKILANHQKRKEMGDHALNFVKKYDIKRCADTIERLYKKARKK